MHKTTTQSVVTETFVGYRKTLELECNNREPADHGALDAYLGWKVYIILVLTKCIYSVLHMVLWYFLFQHAYYFLRIMINLKETIFVEFVILSINYCTLCSYKTNWYRRQITQTTLMCINDWMFVHRTFHHRIGNSN